MSDSPASSPWAIPGVVVLAGVLLGAAVTTAAVQLVSLTSCAAGATPSGIFSGFAYLFAGSETAFDAPGCVIPEIPARLLAGLFLVVLLVALIGGALLLRRLTGDRRGLGSGRDVSRRVAGAGADARTSVFATHNGRPIVARHEDTAIAIAAPRMGKTARIAVWRVRDAPGSCVATSTKPDLVRLTIEMRAKVGAVHVFDPEGVMNWPEPARWDIVAGCEEDREAQERARAIVAARPLGGDSKNSGFFSEAAETVLRCLLHAAAIEGLSMRDVLRWTQDFTDNTPYDILHDNPAAIPGWEQDLRRFCRGDARETVSSTDMSLSLVLKAFAIESILDSVCPPRGTGFDATTLWSTTDTLYLLSESGEASLAAPVITALVASIEKASRRAATRSRTGRLVPPQTFVLDEVANVAPIPTLPSLMADGGGRGMSVWVFAQAPSQLVARWGADGAKTIIASAAVLLVTGGMKDTDFLEEMSRLVGERDVERVSRTRSLQQSTPSTSTSTSSSLERVMTVSELRQLPEGEALLLYREMAPVKVQLPAYWTSKDRSQFESSNAWALAREGF